MDITKWMDSYLNDVSLNQGCPNISVWRAEGRNITWVEGHKGAFFLVGGD